MPGDRMATSLIQKIARQARTTFKLLPLAEAGPGSAPGPGAFQDNLSQLSSLLEKVKAEDLNLTPRRNQGPRQAGPPVTYMHICESEQFSMGVFLLQAGACIPLHDHPGMHGLLKVLYGSVAIECFDKDDGEQAAAGVQFNPPLLQGQRASLRRSLRSSSRLLDQASGPCLLTPRLSNMHRIEAPNGPAAFLDILAPPYDPEAGRDCHYFKVLQPVPGKASSPAPPEQEAVWLLEVPQPADFWCGGEPYPGPQVVPDREASPKE
ncbi:2-aminoethanethiol (cysteamine) dioxygenase a [Chiloscyllium plagiosum]|uniref:2-aminoethanethiol (cysteamine) dioxygenase a n=1 Tax=Chiloscyllium plagiosum TaxID=36176 RepID=UPI001CB88931|nr:2-aminoethanethiol (cysteamine) dioxygenase a [Chiloscyllium plagiosum]